MNINIPYQLIANEEFPGLDPHYGNIGIAVPQINQFDGFDLMDHIGGELEMSPVIPIKATYPMEKVPAYMVGVFSIFEFLHAQNAFPANGEQTIRILDFGRGKPEFQKDTFFQQQQYCYEQDPYPQLLASWINSPRHLKGACPMAHQPPEVTMYGSEVSNGKIGCVWSQQSDIWAIACMVS